MKDKPLVSVIMLTYNHDKYIKTALDSIIYQNVNFEYEIIVADDLSTDNTRKIIDTYVDKYPKKIIPLYRKENLGAPLNFYDALMKCRGNYIAFLEGDDFWNNNNKLQIQLDFLEHNQQYIGVAHRNFIVNKNGKIVGESNKKVPINKTVSKKKLLKFKTNIAHPSSMFYRNFFKKGDFSIIKNSNSYGIHFVMLCLLIKEGDICILPEKMSCWRCIVEDTALNYTSLSRKKPLVFIENYFTMLINFESYFGDYYNYSKIKSYLFSSSIFCVIKSNIKNKKRYMLKFWDCLNSKERIFSFLYFIKIGNKVLFNKVNKIVFNKVNKAIFNKVKKVLCKGKYYEKKY